MDSIAISFLPPHSFFAAIKVDLLSFCSGPSSLLVDCSGWALLQHMLPMLPEIKRQIIHNAACSCSIDIPLRATVFVDEDNPLSYLKESIDFLVLKRSLPTETLSVESNSIETLAWYAFLATRTLQDKLMLLPACRVHLIDSDCSGISMRPAIAGDESFTARDEEKSIIVRIIRFVMESTSHEACHVLLIHGNPGLGKSLLATQALRNAQNQIKEDSRDDVTIAVIRGRGVEVVDEDLVALGHSLGSTIGVASDSSNDVVLASLKCLFKKSRYVVLIDDADAEGMNRALDLLPVSKQRCAVIITSQSLTPSDVNALLQNTGHASAIFRHKELQLFTHQECMQLMMKICRDCDSLLQKEDDLRDIFRDGLGYLPLAVRVFAEWCRKQFNTNMQPYGSAMKAKMLAACKTARELALRDNTPYDRKLVEAKFMIDYESATGHGAASADALLRQWRNEMGGVVLQPGAKYSRGLSGTVRLALLQLESFPADLKEASKQLLGLLSLCPSMHVSWSLFDGGSAGEASLLVRGTRVEVTGVSLEHVSPVGERCRVAHTPNGDSSLKKPLYARVLSDRVEGGYIQIESYVGNIRRVPIADLEFGPHIRPIFCVENGIFRLQLQRPVPAIGVEASICYPDDGKLNGRRALINSHILCSKSKHGEKGVQKVKVALVGRRAKKIKLQLNCLQLPAEVAIFDGGLFLPPRLAPPVTVNFKRGRFIQYHAGDDSISVMFGCDEGMHHVSSQVYPFIFH